MQRLRTVLPLAIAVVLLLSVSAYAQYASTNWPAFQHDERNSGRSAATAVAKPVVKTKTDGTPWMVDLTNGGAFVFDYPSFGGLAIDPNGDVYVQSGGVSGHPSWVVKTNKNGTFGWKANIVNLGGNTFAGPCVLADGKVLAGPGWALGPEKMFALDPITGNSAWSCNFSDLYDNGGDNTPTIGPDGCVYQGLQAGILDNGRILAMDKTTHTVKWVYGGTGQTPLGQNFGSMPWKVVNGKTILFASGAQDAKYHATVDNLIALRDDGAAPTKLWGFKGAFTYGYPSLSDDKNTMYYNTCDSWGGDDLYAFDVTNVDAGTVTKKWSVKVGGNFVYPPAVGADGTVYVTGFGGGNGMQGPSMSYTRAGMVAAVTDNGAGVAPTIKWKLILPDDGGANCSNIVVLNTNPAIMYVATTYSDTSRLYCIKDMGTYGKILWDWSQNARTGDPCALATADDGTLYVAWGSKLIAFETGLNENAPAGISGYVKDASGNPVASAAVAIAATPNPMIECPNKAYTITDQNGHYTMQILAPEDAGTLPVTLDVAAWKDGYMVSSDYPVTVTSLSEAKNQDLTLTTSSGRNWAMYASVSTDWGPKPVNAVDGDYNTNWYCDPAYAARPAGAYVQVDLKQARSIAQAEVHFERWYPKNFEIQYSPDGATWTNAYAKTNAVGGVAQDYDLDQWRRGAEVCKFAAPISARYWRVHGTGGNDRYAVWEFKLDDPTSPAIEPIKSIGDARNAGDEAPVALTNVRVTACPGGGLDNGPATYAFYVEAADRSAAIRVETEDFAGLQIGIGDTVTVQGLTGTTANGEKYVSIRNLSRTGSPRPLDAVEMNTRAANQPASQGMFVKIAGNVVEKGSDYFIVDDGGTAIKVKCGAAPQPDANRVVRVRGVISAEGASACLLMRSELYGSSWSQLDWAYGDAVSQPLPLPGAKKYLRDYMILGPFRKTGAVDADLAGYDFIDVANGGDGTGSSATTESSVAPKLGDTVTYEGTTYTWRRYTGDSDSVDLNKFFKPGGGFEEHSVAYLATYIWSPMDFYVTDVTVGSDDNALVYVNGGKVFEDLGWHGANYGERTGTGTLGAMINLNAGSNTVICKVVNGTSGFGIALNFVDYGTATNFADGKNHWGNGIPTQGLGYLINKQDTP